MSGEIKDSDCVALSNGVLMPKIAFGCAFGNWNDPSLPIRFEPERGWKQIGDGVKAGYRNFDTAKIYASEQVLGITLGMKFADGSLTRDQVFVQTKVFHPIADISFPENCFDFEAFLNDPTKDVKAQIKRDVAKCLHDLKMGYVDLLLAHWPGASKLGDEKQNQRLRREMWAAFEELYESGKVRAIGVSNFLEKHLEPLLKDCKVVPMVNQIEVSPYCSQVDTVNYCKSKGIVVQAWGPFGSGATGVLSDPVLVELAQKHKHSVGQVILRWLVQQGMAAVPRSGSFDRMKSNLDVFSFSLSDEDIAKINALNKNLSSVFTAEGIN